MNMTESASNSVNQQPSSPPPSAGGETVTPANQKKVTLFSDGEFVESGRVLPWLVLVAVIGTLTWVVADAWSLTWQEVDGSRASATVTARSRKDISFGIDFQDWGVYQNDRYKFAVRYPPMWVVRGGNNDLQVAFVNPADEQQIVLITVSASNPEELSLKEWLKAQEWPDPRPVEQQFEDVAPVGGVPAVQSNPPGSMLLTEKDLVIRFDNGAGFERQTVDEHIFRGFLLTFRFTL